MNDSDPEWSATDVLKDDHDGPEHLWQLSPSAIRRWRTPAAKLGGKAYRPGTLDRVKDELNKLGLWNWTPPAHVIATERVQAGDTLSHYASRHYGSSSRWREIATANEDVAPDPNDIFPGQDIRIPKL